MKLPKLKIKKNFVINFVLSIFVAFLLFSLSNTSILTRLKFWALDFSFWLKKSPPVKTNIIIIEATDADIAQVGRWPWARVWHAAMARALYEFGVKDVYFDILFSGISPEEEDASLETALKISRNVHLPFAFQNSEYDINKTVLPLDRFSKFAKGIGVINVYPDPDGTFRKIPLLFQGNDGKYYPHVALKIALDYLGLEIKEIKPRCIIASGPEGILKIPLIEKNTFLINWSDKWENTFKHYSYLDVLAKYKDYLDNRLSDKDIKKFKDSICLVAITALGLGDIKPTPLEPEYPGVGIIATAIDNLTSKDFIYTPPPWVSIFLIFLFSIIPAFAVFGEKPLRASSVILLIATAYAVMSIFLFEHGFYVDMAIPLIGLFSSSLTIGVYNFIRVAIEKQKFFKMAITDGLTGLYNIRYFKMIVETEIMLFQPNFSKKIAIVMSDVDHFKHFNDTYGHQVGDIVLKEVAYALRTTIRSSDVLARYGGEEMIVLLRATTLKDALAVAEKLRKSVESMTVKNEKQDYKVTASFGVSIFRQGDTVDSLIKRADDGLYKSKENGRNRVSSIEI